MKSFFAGILFTVIILVIAGLICIWSGLYNVSQLSPHGSLTKWIISKTMMNSIKRRTRNIEVPAGLGDTSKIAIGFRHYDEMCVVCHQAPGVKVAMPAFATTHKDEDIWAIVAFVVNRLPGITETEYKSMKNFILGRMSDN